MQCAKEIASSAETFKNVLQETYRLKSCIQIASVAPAPLWDIEPLLKKLYPQKGISSFLGSSAEICDKLYNGDVHLVILDESVDDENFICKKYGTEHLYFSAPKGHRFENRKSITFKELNGETMLLLSDIGFWHEIHQKLMPDSRFLLQNSNEDFATLINSSQLPSFSTDVTQSKTGKVPERTDIPITDDDAYVTYYAVCAKKKYGELREFFDAI